MLKKRVNNSKGDEINYSVLTVVSDEQQRMNPLLAYTVKLKTKELEMRLIDTNHYITDVTKNIYADPDRKIKIDQQNVDITGEKKDTYKINISNPNVNYVYCLEWRFK